mgnify:CR=1 FL=1
MRFIECFYFVVFRQYQRWRVKVRISICIPNSIKNFTLFLLGKIDFFFAQKFLSAEKISILIKVICLVGAVELVDALLHALFLFYCADQFTALQLVSFGFLTILPIGPFKILNTMKSLTLQYHGVPLTLVAKKKLMLKLPS